MLKPLVALATVLLATPAFAAEPYVGIGASLKVDHDNPYAGSSALVHVPLDLEIGLALSPAVELHLGGAAGATTSIDEGGGRFGELTAGARWRFFARGALSLAADLTFGVSFAEFENKGYLAETTGLIAEPEIELGVALSDSLALVFGVLARGEHLVGELHVDGEAGPIQERHRQQLGYGTRAMLRWDF